MIGRQRECERGQWGEVLALLLSFVLLLPAFATGAAPPVPPPLPEEPGPGPLFNPEDFHTNPVHMALAVLAGPPIPSVGAISTAGVLVAGENTRAWSLDGVMTNRYSRWSL